MQGLALGVDHGRDPRPLQLADQHRVEVGLQAARERAGKHDEARRSVPLDLGRLTNLLGTSDTIADRVSRYRAAGITTLLAKLEGEHEQQLATLQQLVAITEKA